MQSARRKAEPRVRRCTSRNSRETRPLKVLAPVVKARKGFHHEVAAWAHRQGFAELLVDGDLVQADPFQSSNDFASIPSMWSSARMVQSRESRSLQARDRAGQRTARLLDARGTVHVASTEMIVPLRPLVRGARSATLFIQFAPWLVRELSRVRRGLACRGRPRLESPLEIDLDRERQHESLDPGLSEPCPTCDGARLNEVARAPSASAQPNPQRHLTVRAVRERLGQWTSFHRRHQSHCSRYIAGNHAAAEVSWPGRPRLPDFGAVRENLERRRIATHQAGGPARFESTRSALRAR